MKRDSFSPPSTSGWPRSRRDLPPHAAQRLENVQGLLDKIEEQLRHLSHELRPTILDDLGLRPALEFLADGVSRRTGLQIGIEGSPGARLPTPAETALYRVVQEALTNIARHAEATQVTLRLRCDDEHLRLEVADDGKGFDTGQPKPRSLGLLTMSERARELGGSFAVDTRPGAGTRLTLTVPLL